MGEKERHIAAALFIATALGFPILFSADDGADRTPRHTPFLVENAQLELKIDTVSRLYLADLPGRNGAEAGSEDATDDDGTVPRAFDAAAWLHTTQDLARETRDATLAQIAAACLAVGRDADADRLIAGADLPASDATLFAYLLRREAYPDPQRFRNDLEASGLDPWVISLLQERYAPATGSLAPVADESLRAGVADWVTSVGLLTAWTLLLLLAGIVLLALSPRIVRRFTVRRSVLSMVRFAAPPVYTYLLFAAWFALSTGLSMVVVPLLSKDLSDASVILAAYLVTAGVGILLVRYRGMQRSESLLKSVDLDRPPAGAASLLLGVAAYVTAVPVVLTLSVLSALLFGGGEEGTNPAIPVLVEAGGIDRWLLVLNVVVMAPLFEEFFFRGFLFQQFRRFFSLTNAILLSALVFAAVHLSIESFLPLFGLGILLAGVYHVTQSLWAAMITHALWNLGTVITVVVVFG